MKDKIDFVITWVDGNDTEWLKEKNKYRIEKDNQKNIDNRSIRYRDIDCLKYWFRAVEKYAPWVNKIYFVTYGHIPNWLNTSNEKIVVVNHKDIIPKEYLPTFNASAIELFLHRIPNLSNNFVYFNDDMFITDYVKEKDFFNNNIPCDNFGLRPISIDPSNHDAYYKKICNDVEFINKYFNFKKWLKRNIWKCISPKQGKYILRTIPSITYKNFIGFHIFHLPISFKKETFDSVWNTKEEILIETAKSKFRNNRDNVNGWVFQYWQYATGDFKLRKSNFGYSVQMDDKRIRKLITKRKYKLLCVNDNDHINNFEASKQELIDSFEIVLSKKSQYEK